MGIALFGIDGALIGWTLVYWGYAAAVIAGVVYHEHVRHGAAGH
jgi:hypothetical protein